MEKKKHKFFWEEDEKDEKNNLNAHSARSVPAITHIERKPMAFGFRFHLPPFPSASKSDIAIKENEKDVIVTAMFPGFSKEDMKIDINQNYIRIRAEKKKSAKRHSDSASFSMEEMSCVERTASLPESVEPQHARVDFAHGILTITMPKAKKKKFSIFRRQ